VALLTLDRPERRNALSSELLDALIAEVARLRADPDVRAAVLAGAGPSFCAGGDLAEMDATTDAGLPAYLGRFQRLARAVRGLGKPLVAAVHGHAVAGGFELACLCHLRIVATDCTLRVGDVAVGLSPTSGLTWLLPRLVGLGQAHRLALLSPDVDGPQAVALGLAEEHVPATAVLDRALAVAERIARWPGIGVPLTVGGLERAAGSTFAGALAAEVDDELACFADGAPRDVMAAFLRGNRPAGDESPP
jgi:2-(1,2-epoxy-1,2-dihydrophenyl)acetyl-CoA isomerase